MSSVWFMDELDKNIHHRRIFSIDADKLVHKNLLDKLVYVF